MRVVIRAKRTVEVREEWLEVPPRQPVVEVMVLRPAPQVGERGLEQPSDAYAVPGVRLDGELGGSEHEDPLRQRVALERDRHED